MVQLWVVVAEEEGHCQRRDGGDAAGELETVEGLPVRVGEVQEEG